MLATIGIFTGVCMLYLVISTHAVKTSFECNGTRHRFVYRQVFSLSLLVNKVTVAHIDSGSSPEIVYNKVANVSDLVGVLSEHEVELQGVLDVECNLAQRLDCQLYGYISTSDDNYKRVTFQPTVEFEAGIQNASVSQEVHESSHVILLTCSAVVGSNRTDISWQSSTSPGVYSAPDGHSNTVKWTSLPHCRFIVISHLTYSSWDGQERMYFKCMHGKTDVGLISVGAEVTSTDHLSLHLFLSTLFLVYGHFVIIPLLCVCFKRNPWIKKFQDPRKEGMRMVRGSISVGVAVVFIIWWAAVLNLHVPSYLGFLLIEAFFLLLYAVTRLLSHYLEKEGDRHLYNGRVALSCGAVITPSICWIMIKSQQEIPFSGIECVWWIVTGIILFAFVFVSHERELKAWEKVR